MPIVLNLMQFIDKLFYSNPDGKVTGSGLLEGQFSGLIRACTRVHKKQRQRHSTYVAPQAT